MKVHGSPRPGPVDIQSTRSARGAGRAESPVKHVERVELSEEAKALLEGQPEVPDQQRIERLKAAIRDGSFVVDYGRIADAMLREEF